MELPVITSNHKKIHFTTFMKKIGMKFLLAVILIVFTGTYLILQKKYQYLLLTSSIPVNGKN